MPITFDDGKGLEAIGTRDNTFMMDVLSLITLASSRIFRIGASAKIIFRPCEGNFGFGTWGLQSATEDKVTTQSRKDGI
jgi:hypothetical protein